MMTAWSPTPDELERLMQGACVYVELLNLRLPAPMMVSVGQIPTEENENGTGTQNESEGSGNPDHG
jgi:hypothetical protein